MSEIFLVIAAIIAMGVIGNVVFERTRISQALILILFGFLLGPIFGIVDVSASSIVVSILPFVATLALIILLFDGGLTLELFSLGKTIPKGLLFTVAVFLISLAAVGLFSVLVLGWPILQGLLLGAVAGGTSSAIVIAMVEKTRASSEAKNLLTIESTVTDALCIISAVIILDLIVSNRVPDPGMVANALLSSFSIAIVLGAVVAMWWMASLNRFKLHQYSYMLTLALVFGLYFVAEFVRANGGFAVFMFGLVLGNSVKIGELLKLEWQKPESRITFLQSEVTFFVRTFFFVYIGLLLSLSYFTPIVVGVSIFLLLLFLGARSLGTRFLLPKFDLRDQRLTQVILPRGLAAAVLATLPASQGLDIPLFLPIVFGVIVLSNVVATVGIFHFDRETEEDKKKAAEEAKNAKKTADSDKKK